VASGISVPVPSASSQAAASFASAASLAAATVAQSPAFQAIVGSSTQAVQRSVPSISLPSQALNVGGTHQPSAFTQMSLAQPSSTSGAQLSNHSSFSSLPDPLAPGLNGANLSAAVANMDACFNSLNGGSNHANNGGQP